MSVEETPPPGSTVLSLYRGVLRVPEVGRPTRYDLALSVAQRHGLSIDVLRGTDRSRRVAWPRQEAMWLMSRHGYGPGPIGHTLNRTTWTVTHGIDAHAKRLAEAAPE